MVKFLTVSYLLIFSTISLANGTHNTEKVDKWYAEADFITKNDKIPSNWENMRIGLKGTVGYKINTFFYSSISMRQDNKDHFIGDASVGAQFVDNTHSIVPYCEIDIITHRINEKRIAEIGYDVGAKFKMNKKLYPYVEIHDLLKKNGGEVYFGAYYNLFKEVIVDIKYKYNPRNRFNSALMGVRIPF